MALVNSTLSTSAANIYASSGSTVVSVAYFCNTDTTARTFNLYAVQAGGTADGSNQIYANVQIAADDTFVIDMEKLVLANGETLQANASVSSKIVATVSYVGI